MHTHVRACTHMHTHTITPAQDLRQFWTLFPHTPDNSFLGFVVEPVAMATDMDKKKNQGVLYGKEGTTAALVAALHCILQEIDSKNQL